jgi:hypothetical protein
MGSTTFPPHGSTLPQCRAILMHSRNVHLWCHNADSEDATIAACCSGTVAMRLAQSMAAIVQRPPISHHSNTKP